MYVGPVRWTRPGKSCTGRLEIYFIEINYSNRTLLVCVLASSYTPWKLGGASLGLFLILSLFLKLKNTSAFVSEYSENFLKGHFHGSLKCEVMGLVCNRPILWNTLPSSKSQKIPSFLVLRNIKKAFLFQ